MIPIHEQISLVELIQAVRRKTIAEPIDPDEYGPLVFVTGEILQACAYEDQQFLSSRDMQEIRGQYHVKRALEVAAAGGHNILLVGPPGAGKDLLAQAFPSILPHTSVPAPFRQPISSIERTAFLGKIPFPGELTLAHGGVLFLKDLASFDQP